MFQKGGSIGCGRETAHVMYVVMDYHDYFWCFAVMCDGDVC